jgi:MoaA/NifB/PqqE/SkfB family radical SAM enzyme
VNLPSFVQIEPVGQCNLKCRMCPVMYRDAKPPAFMSYEAYCRLIDQFDGLTELHLQGLGEPLLHPRFFDMVRYAAARGIEVSTNTNLTALSARRADDCVGSGLRRLYVSLDAADAATYEYIRVGARFDKVLRNLGWLTEAKRRHESPFPDITLVAVAMRRNLDSLAALVRLAHEQGVRAMSVQQLAHDFSDEALPMRYRPMRRFVDEEGLAGADRARVERAFAQARAVAAALGVELRLPNPAPSGSAPPLRGRSRCDWPWRGAYIAYSGEAMPCCMVATPDRANLGSMTEQGVAPVWDGEAYHEFRARLESDNPPDVCKGCAIYHGRF